MPPERAALIRLGQAERPWAFLKPALSWLANNPNDHGVRFLAGENAVSLGLITLAQDCLAPLPDAARQDPRVAALLSAVASGKDCALQKHDRINWARRHTQALRDRGITLEPASVQAWVEAQDTQRWFQAIDGNLVHAVRQPDGELSWHGLADQLGDANALVSTHIQCDAYTAPGPVVLEGLSNPSMLAALSEALPPTTTGYQTPIHVLEQSPAALLNAIARENFEPYLTDPRVRFYIGSSCGAAYRDSLLAFPAFEKPSLVLRGDPEDTNQRPQPTPEQAIRECTAAQQQAIASLRHQAETIFANRTDAWWRNRFAELRAGRGDQLRVVILSSRFTTFIQHAAEDFAEAVRQTGGTATIVVEPDEHSRLTRVAQLQAIVADAPDFLLAFNYTRHQLGEQLPRRLPMVCWIQDAMGHLFDKASGATQGPLDVLLGYHFADLYQHHGYPQDRYLYAPVAVNPRKFAPSTSTTNSSPLACEVAYVSHHSETPTAMAERLAGEMAQPELAAIVPTLFPELERVAFNVERYSLRHDLRPHVVSAIQACTGAEAPIPFVNQILTQVATPLIERMVRHQTLAWAAAICSRYGWRFRIHGHGWESHPTLAPFSAGPLRHGDDLRDCYQHARAHLHASASPLTHQRLAECALAGGLPLVRLNQTAWVRPEEQIASLGWRPATEIEARDKSILPEARPELGDRCRLADHAIGYCLTDHPQLLEHASRAQRLGVERHTPTDHILWCDPRGVRQKLPQLDIGTMSWHAHDLFSLLEDHAFTDEASLEHQLRKAIEDDEWRDQHSQLVAKRAQAFMSTDATLHRLLQWFPVPASR